MSARSESFKPSERFTLLRRVGAGGMGLVYEAYDQERKVRVALKTLSRLDPERLYLFKQEFRALADITHPNLAKLYELISEDGEWYFTMEFVDGRNLLEFAWQRPPEAIPTPGRDSGTDTTPTASLSTVPLGVVARPKLMGPLRRTERRASFDSIRSVLRQMVDGINFLHGAGKLHRDIKPSNIMVTDEGHVVLLDFGLISEILQNTPKTGFISGTVAYMPPEQAVGAPLTEAADWYAAGCTLYEVLTGRLPFEGDDEAIIKAKLGTDPPSPQSVMPGIPPDLAQLATDLLRRLPEERPPGSEIVRRVGGPPDAQAEPELRPALQTLLVGREHHLEQLRRFLSTAESRKPVLTFVHGPSGFGKTALIDAFLDELSRNNRGLVLRGRCYEQESVPYKAFDSLVDSLVRYLQTLPEEERETVLPHNRQALAQLFPVTQRIVRSETPLPDLRPPDRLELRRMAFDALWELFQRLASRQPLVLFIDDLHWGDLDSALLLAEILRSSGRLPMLIVCCYRSEYAQTSACLKAIWESRFDASVERRELVVGPLDTTDSERLALTVLTGDMQTRRQRAQAIASEAKGSPFFVMELASYIREEQTNLAGEGKPGPRTSEVGLDQMLWQRVCQLPEQARALLEVVAVSGQPLRRRDACRAATQGVDDPSVMNVLRTARLVRSAGMTREDEIETYHDRIRESIMACLAPQVRREHHRKLARTLEEAGGDPERLAVHFHEGGDARKAGQYYRLGAGRASQALAFDRACGLYQKALELLEPRDVARHELTVQLADALANAGRGPQAAQQYLAACATAPPQEIVPLKQKAAYQFCASGHVDQGKETFRQVLAAVGTSLPQSPRAAVASLLWHKFRLQLRGLNFREQPASAVPPAVLIRLNALSFAATGLGMVDLVAGADFAARFLLLSLQVGELAHVSRALAWHAMQSSGSGGPLAETKGMPLLALTRAAAERSGDPLALAWSRLAAGVAHLQFCRWRSSIEMLEETLTFLRKDCRDVAWEIATARTCQLLSLNGLGEYRQLGEKYPALLKDATERGDVYAATNIGTWIVPPGRLAADDPRGARESIHEYGSRWSQSGFHLQHLWALISETYVDLYEGAGRQAVQRLEQQWPAASGSLLFRIYLPRTFSYHVRARAYLQAAETAADPKPLLARVLHDCRTLEQEKTRFTFAKVLLLRAGVAAVSRNQEAAVALLRQAERAYLDVEMNAYLAAARYHLARLVGGDEGREFQRLADEWMTQQSVRNPQRMVALHAPGFSTLGG